MASPYLNAPIRTVLEAALDSAFGNAESRRDIFHFLDAVRIPVIVTNASFGPGGPRTLFVNDEMCRLCGFRQSELIGFSPRLLQGPQTDLASASAFRTQLETHGTANVQLVNYRADGTSYSVCIAASKVDLGVRLDDELRIAFQTEVAADHG